MSFLYSACKMFLSSMCKFSHVPLERWRRLLLPLNAETTFTEGGPCRDMFINYSPLPVHYICILVCVKKTTTKKTKLWTWAQTELWASLHLIGQISQQMGSVRQSQSFLLSLIFSAAPAGLSSHCGLFTLSLANKTQNMTCALVSITLLPLKTRFSSHHGK